MEKMGRKEEGERLESEQQTRNLRGTYETAYGDGIWMCFSTRCALDFEGVEEWFCFNVEGAEVGHTVEISAMIGEEKVNGSVPGEIRCECESVH